MADLGSPRLLGALLTKKGQEGHPFQDADHLLDLGFVADQQQVVPHKQGQQVAVLGLLQERPQDLGRLEGLAEVEWRDPPSQSQAKGGWE